MRPAESRRHFSPRLRLQVLLLALIAWDVVGVAAEVAFGSPLLRISGTKVTGLLGGRASLGGAFLIPLAVYVQALAGGPLKHRGAFWVAVIDQGATALFGVYHLARGDLALRGAWLSIAVGASLLVLVLMNMPREQPTT
jgi:hypothetical protein